MSRGVRRSIHYGGRAGRDIFAWMFEPRLHILPEPQRVVWDELSSTPADFTLYGGTAIALYLAHRVSVDFDFFSSLPFSPAELMERVPYLHGATLRQSAANTLTVSVERGGPVQFSFFGGLRLGQVRAHEHAEGTGIAVASLADLSGMKVAVVTQRAELKDYFDIHALLMQAKIPLAEMLAAAAIIDGDSFSPLIALKAISYHDDQALKDLPQAMRSDLIAAVRTVDVTSLPILDAVRRRPA